LIRGEVFRLSSNELNIISEADGEAVLLAERVGVNLGAATLQFTTNEIVGSATPGVDFTPPQHGWLQHRPDNVYGWRGDATDLGARG
jgi:hypothetical protein